MKTSCDENGSPGAAPAATAPRAGGQRQAMDRPRAPVLLSVLLTFCITAGTPAVWVQVQMEAATSLSFTVRCGFLGSGSISLVTVSSGGADGAGGRLAVLHPEFGIQQWSPARQAHWETKTSISLAVGEGPEGRSPGANTTFCCKFVSFPEGSQEACGSLFLSTDPGGAEERGQGGQGGTPGLQPPSPVRLFVCTQGSLPRRQLPCCGLTWPGSLGCRGSSSLAVSTSSTSCIGRGTGRSARPSRPSPVPSHRREQGRPVKPPWSLCARPAPPSPPAATARPLWTWSSRPSRWPAGRPCPPRLATASSPWRTDFMLRPERGLSKLAPTSSLSLTLWGTGPRRGI